MNNSFASAVRTATETENGHYAVNTTGSAVLDLYGQIGAVRGMPFDQRVRPLIEKAMKEDPLLTMKTIFYGRDARGGTGERQLFRDAIKYLAIHYPTFLSPNIHLIPEYGRWDDLYALVGTPAEHEASSLIDWQFAIDTAALKVGDSVSLLGKWLKSCNTSSAESCKLGQWTRNCLHLSERDYRKSLSALRERIRVVEKQMSANDWSGINYEAVPSRASVIYRKAFAEHDEARYRQYIEDVMSGKRKMNASVSTPQDIVHAYLPHLETQDDALEAAWKSLPDFVRSDENIMIMADTSGSMTGRPMEVSAGLATYFAQHNKGAFHNMFMTFETDPHFITLSDNTPLRVNLHRVWRAPWGGSTNLNGACVHMLRFARDHHVPNKDMPSRLIIVSDMEIDHAVSARYRLHSKETADAYHTYGYTMPQIIYWNVAARDNHFQAKADSCGVMLASGSSPAIFEGIMKMQDTTVTPYDAMMAVLNSERYKPITI